MTRHLKNPSLAQLRTRVFKHSEGRGPEVGNVLARRVGRPSAVFGTWVAVRLGVSAHLVTGLAIAVSGIGAALIGTGGRWEFFAGVLLFCIAYWLDHIDGQVARWQNTACLEGVYLDYLMHHAQNLMLGFALGMGLAARFQSLRWAVAGFAIALGWCFLGLQNDCRYKAFFQRLKRGDELWIVAAGAGGRPAPPPSWPRRGAGLVTWPMAKVCEPHVVLMTLVGLAALAVAAPRIWVAAWSVYTIAMAAIAPILTIARTARDVKSLRVQRGFEAWFRPVDCETSPENVAVREAVTATGPPHGAYNERRGEDRFTSRSSLRTP